MDGGTRTSLGVEVRLDKFSFGGSSVRGQWWVFGLEEGKETETTGEGQTRQGVGDDRGTVTPEGPGYDPLPLGLYSFCLTVVGVWSVRFPLQSLNMSDYTKFRDSRVCYPVSDYLSDLSSLR